MATPLITIIVTTYKRPQMLSRAIVSILNQAFSDFQILIADNASGPETDIVIQQWMKVDSRIKWLKQPINLGAPANFCIALEQVTTPYVCILPDDDFFGPSFFEEALPYFDLYPDIAFCGGGGLIMDQNYRVQDIVANGQMIPKSGYYPAPSGFFTYLRSVFGIAFPSLLFKMDYVRQVRGFDSRLGTGLDEDLVSKCSARFPVYLLADKPHYFAFQHSGSLSRVIDYALFERDCLIFYENLQSVCWTAQEKKEIDLFFKQRRLKILSNAYRYHCDRKEFVQASSYAEKVHTLTCEVDWKKKKYMASLYQRCPVLYPLYIGLKKLEKGLRTANKKCKEVKGLSEHPDQAKWKAYTLQLEQTAKDIVGVVSVS